MINNILFRDEIDPVVLKKDQLWLIMTRMKENNPHKFALFNYYLNEIFWRATAPLFPRKGARSKK